MGGGQFAVAQLVPAPRKVPICAVHWAAVTDTHEPSERQHAPRGHTLPAAHDDPSPRYVPPAMVHCSAVNTRQALFAKQQAPVGAGQSPGAHATLSP